MYAVAFAKQFDSYRKSTTGGKRGFHAIKFANVGNIESYRYYTLIVNRYKVLIAIKIANYDCLSRLPPQVKNDNMTLIIKLLR